MNLKPAWLSAAAALFLTMGGCAEQAVAPPTATDGPGAAFAVGAPIPGRYVVVFNGGVADAPGLARRLAATHGGTIHFTYQHAIKGFAATLPAGAAEALRRNPQVAYVHPDQRVHATQITQSPAPWGLDRLDQRDRPLDNRFRYARTGAGVTVYVIDTGIETAHAEFGGRASVGFDAFNGNGQDCNGHGTHVAGTVAGSTYGVAKAANVVAVRVLDCNGYGSTATVVAGLDWVRANRQGPAVANLSLGGGADQAIDDALRSVIQGGVTAVVAAGNQPADNACGYSPARVGEALTVGATTAGDARASFSKFGPCVDLFAPGEGITSSWINGGTHTISGTSMAAPHVAGTAALFLQSKGLSSPATVHGVIVSDASSGKLSSIGTGSPNLLLSTLSSVPFVVSINGPAYITVRDEYTWTAEYSGGGTNPQFSWEISYEGSYWSSLGSGPTQNYSAGGMDFYLRVTGIRATDGAQAQAIFFVQAPCMETNPDYACY